MFRHGGGVGRVENTLCHVETRDGGHRTLLTHVSTRGRGGEGRKDFHLAFQAREGWWVAENTPRRDAKSEGGGGEYNKRNEEGEAPPRHVETM